MLEQQFSRDQAEGLRQLMTAPPVREISVLVSSDELNRNKLYRLLVSELSLRDTNCLYEVDGRNEHAIEQLLSDEREIVICLNQTSEGIKQTYRILKRFAEHSSTQTIGIYVAATSSKQARTICGIQIMQGC